MLLTKKKKKRKEKEMAKTPQACDYENCPKR